MNKHSNIYNIKIIFEQLWAAGSHSQPITLKSAISGFQEEVHDDKICREDIMRSVDVMWSPISSLVLEKVPSEGS